MNNRELLIGQLIEIFEPQDTEKAVDSAIDLWELLTVRIISIIGEAGFDSLYARSIFITQSTYPWLAASLPPPQAVHRFAELKTCLAGQTPAQASEANRLLLITFTDILASLIGENLIMHILRSTWSNDTSNKPGQELKK